jgi:hypothetical protein
MYKVSMPIIEHRLVIEHLNIFLILSNLNNLGCIKWSSTKFFDLQKQKNSKKESWKIWA